MWNTYYYLKEALKSQKPKVIVLEGFCTYFGAEFQEKEYIVFNNFGLHWSPDKIESIEISAPKENWDDFFLEYTQYHTRYAELSREDFLHNQGNPLYEDWKGFYCNMLTTPFTVENVMGVEDRTKLPEKTEEYYRAIIELSKEEDIPIVVVMAPYMAITTEFQKCFNEAGDIADEMGVPFLNCNLHLEEIGLDFSTDAADTDHLNYRGSQKFARYLGEYIVSNYDLPDRRGDPQYSSWERHADFIRQMIYNQELVETVDKSVLCEKVKEGNYWTIISVDGVCNNSELVHTNSLQALGIDDKDATGMWILDAGEQVWCAGIGDNTYYTRTAQHDVLLTRTDNGDGSFTNSIIIDNVRYTKVENGINVVIYDPLTESIVDAFGFNADDGYNLVR